jgi:hypothetical protein
VSDHDGVHDAHRHPAEFGEDERQGEREHRPDLVTDGHDFLGGTPSQGVNAKLHVINYIRILWLQNIDSK